MAVSPIHTRHTTSPQSSAVRFGSGALGAAAAAAFGPNSWNGFFTDTFGILLPKLGVARTGKQAFEEVALEIPEDLAFYFAPPFLGTLFAHLAQKAFKLKEAVAHIGTPVAEVAKSVRSSNLLGAKVGTVFATLSVACGFEFLIQHGKNWLTAKYLNTKNFEAVAGLEEAKSQANDGYEDPVDKAKRRFWQVPLITLAGLAGSVALAALVGKFGNHDAVKNTAKSVLRWLEFDKTESKAFGLSKGMLFAIAGTGFFSYLDASRSHLEFKENLLRVPLVILYYMIGKEAVGKLLIHWANHRAIPVGQQSKLLKELVELTPQAGQKSLSWTKENLFQFALVDAKSPWSKFLTGTHLKSDLEQHLAKTHLLSGETLKQVTQAVYRPLKVVRYGAYAVSALLIGVALNLVSYAITKERYRQQQVRLQAQKLTLAQKVQAAFQRNPIANPAFYAASPIGNNPWRQASAPFA